MSFFVTADGGLTTAGYVGCVVLMVALVVIASVLSAQKSKGTGMDARKLAFCAMAMALPFVTSYLKVFELPYGGSVTSTSASSHSRCSVRQSPWNSVTFSSW